MPHLDLTALNLTPKTKREPITPVGLRLLGAALGVVLCFFFFPAADASGQSVVVRSGSIWGKVSDAVGEPLPGALVSVRSPSTPADERFVVTDSLGKFTVPGLGAGEYLVRVTKSAFQPYELGGVVLLPGGGEALTIVLQTAMDFVKRGIRRGRLEDMVWVLRSSQATRPILRHSDAAPDVGGWPDAAAAPSGYFQVYSSSIEASDGPSDAVGSQFAVTVPAAGGQVRVEGQYTESHAQPRGLGATYEFSSGGRQRSSLGVNVRQGAYFSEADSGDPQREIAVEYLDQLQWSNDLVVQYGATVGRSEGASDRNYMRPELGVAWVVRPWTTLRATYSRRSPADNSDPIRGREFFDRAVYIPAELERFSHVEVGLTQAFGNGFQISASAFRDEFGTQAFLIDADDGRRAFLVVDGTGMPTTGGRIVADREFDGFDASVSYAYVSAFGFAPDVESPQDLRTGARRKGYHVVTARVHGKIELTQTEMTAVYRWAPGFPLGPVDPYQVFAEYNDPTLSFTLAQDLPSGGLLPARLQAVVDARNLFETSFGSHRTTYASHPRMLRGGIHFKF